MAYQVLARKWRPNKFSELVGQEHVVAAITNALENNRLHHAYLFTGTRGVGKTTIARIFSKSLNCETGLGANPCGECHTCKEIENGSYVDLLEIDAASRTKVEDTREILDNVQYKPTRGEYKVYLIDEVHMLSKHSFNALLKTLEEPPPHVKFLLATTDPQKLPVTILSRCLQFNLKALSRDQIATQLDFVLNQESLSFEPKALAQIARAAQGSMRDALSLTDQAIAQGNGLVTDAVVTDMLGLMDKNQILKLVHSVFSNDAQQVMEQVDLLSMQSANLEQVLNEFMSLLHQVALTQYVPDACKLETVSARAVYQLAKMLPAEQVQLAYQIALQGKKDINFAADARIGLEMTLLRMLAFNPSPVALSIDETNEKSLQNVTPNVSSQSLPAMTEADLKHEVNYQASVTSESIENTTLSNLSSQQDDILQQAAAISPHHVQEMMQDEVQVSSELNSAQIEVSDFDEQQAEIDAYVQNTGGAEAPVNTQTDLSSPTVNNPVNQGHSTQSLIALKNQLAQKEIASEVASDSSKKSEESFSPERFTGNTARANKRIDKNAPLNEPLSADFSNQPIDSHAAIQPLDSKPTSTQQDTNETFGKTEQVSIQKIESDKPISELQSPEQSNDLDAQSTTHSDPPPWDSSTESNVNDSPDIQDHSTNVESNDAFDPTAHLSDPVEVTVDFEVPVFLESGEKVTEAQQLDTWSQLIEQMPIAALTKQLALHSAYYKNAGEVTLKLLESKPHLDTELARGQLQQALSEMFDEDIVLRVEHTQPINTPFAVQQTINQVRLSHARKIAETDENIQRLKTTFAGEIVEDSIQPR